MNRFGAPACRATTLIRPERRLGELEACAVRLADRVARQNQPFKEGRKAQSDLLGGDFDHPRSRWAAIVLHLTSNFTSSWLHPQLTAGTAFAQGQASLSRTAA